MVVRPRLIPKDYNQQAPSESLWEGHKNNSFPFQLRIIPYLTAERASKRQRMREREREDSPKCVFYYVIVMTGFMAPIPPPSHPFNCRALDNLCTWLLWWLWRRFSSQHPFFAMDGCHVAISSGITIVFSLNCVSMLLSISPSLFTVWPKGFEESEAVKQLYSGRSERGIGWWWWDRQRDGQ